MLLGRASFFIMISTYYSSVDFTASTLESDLAIRFHGGKPTGDWDWHGFEIEMPRNALSSTVFKMEALQPYNSSFLLANATFEMNVDQNPLIRWKTHGGIWTEHIFTKVEETIESLYLVGTEPPAAALLKVSLKSTKKPTPSPAPSTSSDDKNEDHGTNYALRYRILTPYLLMALVCGLMQ